jgi:hypothetical protein
MDALKGGVYVAGVHVKKNVWIQETSLWQSTTLATVHVCVVGRVDWVQHPDKKTSPTRVRRKNIFFIET